VNAQNKGANKLVFCIDRSPEDDQPYIADSTDFPLSSWQFVVATWTNDYFLLYRNASFIGSNHTAVALDSSV
jgi:hypothetical protein